MASEVCHSEAVHSTAGSVSSESSEGNDGVLLRRERLKLRCLPGKCRVRWVRSKGAILVLLLNCLTVDVITLLLIFPRILSLNIGYQVTIVISNFIQALSIMLLFPLTGWLADAYVGRYKIVRASMWLAWVGMIATAVGWCILHGVGESYKPIAYTVFFIAFLLLECGVAGFKANVVAYGTDQLVESSSDELSGYVHWITCTSVVAFAIISFPYPCIIENHLLAVTLVSALSLSVVLCLNFYLKDWLIIEPATRNPIKLIYQVLNYARKNKYARFRSAFTFHIQKIPSRMEMAKSHYGGPFTVEQVEDVKTFFRIIVVLIPASGMFSIGIDGLVSLAYFSFHVRQDDECFVNWVVKGFLAFVSGIVIVPVYEFIIYPLIHNFIPSILVRIGIGFLFYIAAFGTLLAIDTVGHVNLADPTNVTCLFSITPTPPLLDVSNKWLVLPCLLLGFGIVINISATYEFILAQSPYSMKGLLMGLLYGFVGVYFCVYSLLQLLFRFGAVQSSVTFPSCSSSYFLVLIVFSLALLVWYICVARQYKKRVRDPPDNLHVFVEDYYDKYLSIN